MSTASRARSWWRALFHRQNAENDVETELAFHIESYAADLEREGMARKEALQRAKTWGTCARISMKAPKLKNQIGERSETGRSKAVSIRSLELMGRL